jgi:hypothetical protein
MYLTADWEYRRWEKAQRYYEAHIHQDLWGEWVLTKVWGRQGTLLGRAVHVPCTSYRQACEWLTELRVRREKRGYSRRTINTSC